MFVSIRLKREVAKSYLFLGEEKNGGTKIISEEFINIK